MKQTLVFHASDRHFGKSARGYSKEWGHEESKVAGFDTTIQANKFVQSIFDRTKEDAVIMRTGGKFEGLGNGTLISRNGETEAIGEMHRTFVNCYPQVLTEAMEEFCLTRDCEGVTAIETDTIGEYEFIWFK